jgi:4-amino-4-deoxy-L-arabinose transferase-like glycosyltransferase
VASYLTLRELSLGRGVSLLGALLVAVNPAFVLLSYSYMTDVPFLAWFTLGLWCYVRGLRRDDWRWLLAGSLFATLAVLIRQNGVALPGALGAYLGWQWLRRQRGFPWREGLAGALLPLAALALLTVLSRVGVMPDRSNALVWIDTSLTAPALLVDLFRVALYMGLFTLPVTAPLALAILWQDGRFRLKNAIAPAAWFLLAATGAIVQFNHPFKLPYLGTWRMMPYFPTVWTVYGTGSQEEWLAGTREMIFSYRFWVIITALACAGAALLMWQAARSLWPARREEAGETTESGWPVGFLLLLVAAYLAPVLLFKGEIYERYLLGALLPISALILRRVDNLRGRPIIVAVIGLGLSLAFSLALTGEFVAWNGAAWQAAGRLEAEGAPAEHIDGGFPFNGWRFADLVGKTNKVPEAGAPAYMEVTPHITRDYVVSFSPIEGYEVVDRQPYWSPLNWREKELVVLRRVNGG